MARTYFGLGIAMALAIGILGCEDEANELGATPDTGTTADAEPTSQEGQACERTAECAQDMVCAYEVGDCDGQPRGTCRRQVDCPDQPTGNVFCACGITVFYGNTGCAEQPVRHVMTPGRACGGIPIDAGPQTCRNAQECGPGESCSFDDVACGDPGLCVPSSSCIGDAGVREYCGCDGRRFYDGTLCVSQPVLPLDQCTIGTDGGPGDSGAASLTPCGPEACDSATQICVVTDSLAGPEYRCSALPRPCGNDRSCACLGDLVCGGDPFECFDVAQENRVQCTCPAC